jgi:hypothetical protein
MRKIIITLGLVCILLGTNFKNNGSIKPLKDRDYVPDENTAIKVAEAIWFPILGDLIDREKPFTAHLNGNIWLVKGTAPDSSFGGPITIEIRKSDCKILSLMIPK